MGVIDDVLSILAESKNILELPTASNPLDTDWAIIWNNNANRAEKVKLSNISSASPWKWIDGSWVVKATGNTDLAALEVSDMVFFKTIANDGDSLILVGQTYLGGDNTLRDNYEQITSIDI